MTIETHSTKTEKYGYASFILRGKELDPAYVTEAVGFQPYKSFKRGDTRKNGKLWPHGYWELCSLESVETVDLMVHIEFLVGKIEAAADVLIPYVENRGIESLISCFASYPDHHLDVEFNQELLKRLGQLNLKLRLDLYLGDSHARPNDDL